MVEAIYRSGRDGRPVTLPRLARVDATARADTPAIDSPLRQVPLGRREAG